MTIEKLNELNQLKDDIERLTVAIYMLQNNHYKYFEIRGVCDDGVSDYICSTEDDGTDGFLECITSFLMKTSKEKETKLEEG